MELRVFVSRLEICPRGVAPEIKVLFCAFIKWGFLWEFVDLLFEGLTFNLFSITLISRSNILMSNALSKLPKVTKSAKS